MLQSMGSLSVRHDSVTEQQFFGDRHTSSQWDELDNSRERGHRSR